MELNFKLRMPADVEYGFIEVEYKATSPHELKMAVLDSNSEFWIVLGDAYKRARGMFAIGSQLGGQVIGETTDPTWPNEPSEPSYASGYEGQAPGGYQAPPNQGYQYQQPPPAAQPRKGPLPLPPGTQPRACHHGTKTLIDGRYGPFWACPADKDDPGKCKAEKFYG